MYELPWIAIFGHEWGDLSMIFKSDEVTRENHWQIVSRETKKVLFTVTNISFYFLHAIWYHEHKIPIKNNNWSLNSPLSLRTVWISIVASPQMVCDVTQTWSTGIVTPYSSIILAGASLRKGGLHWWITMSIGFSSPGIHDLSCKKKSFIHSQTSNGQQLKFGNGYVISSHTLLEGTLMKSDFPKTLGISSIVHGKYITVTS